MIINRAKLRGEIDTAIAAHRADYDKRLAAYEASQVEIREEWVAKHTAAWRTAANTIRRRISRGEPITLADLPQRDSGGFSGSYPVLFHPSTREGVRNPGSYTEPHELLTLAAALDMIVDDEVTTAGLERIGIGRAALSLAFRAVADARRAAQA